MRNLEYFSQVKCQSGGGFDLLNVPTWYEYLRCDENNTPIINSLNDIWKIATAILDILLWLGGVVAVFFIIYGGIQYIISQGSPDKTAQARQTLLYAIAGFIITIIARVAVDFIVNQLS